jgi:ATPase family associated with various cellular activities (AAA)
MNNPSLEEVLKDIKRQAKISRKRSQYIKVKKLDRTFMETADDGAQFNSQDYQDKGVVLGVYGIEDWILGTIIKNRYLKSFSSTQLDGTWLTEASFDLNTWVKNTFSKYIFFTANVVVAYEKDDSVIKIRYGRGKIEVEISANPEHAFYWHNVFDTTFKKAENLIQWVYNTNGDEITVPLKYRPAIRSAYPWINKNYKNVADYIDEYIDSDANVLILIGPPGTGKTSFIKNLIYRSKADAKVAYDPKVMMDDGFFAGFIADDTRFLVMEDADEFLQARSEGNTMMHKFLNLSDGLISAADKKLVFSTNLENVSDIDEALMRPGRCFDVLEFRALNRDEALDVHEEIGLTTDLADGNKFTLAEIFSKQPSGKVSIKRKIGF